MFCDASITGHSAVAHQAKLATGLPWLHNVNAQISIRSSSIEIGDHLKGEKVWQVVGPEMVFYNEHNFLLYPKSVITSINKRILPSKLEPSSGESGTTNKDLGEDSDSESSETDDNADSLSAVEDLDF